MKKDTHKTKVVFLYHTENDDLFAIFPEIEEGENQVCSYAHVGQHSACSIGYINDCRIATQEEGADLFAELESIGYNLQLTDLTTLNMKKPTHAEIIKFLEENPQFPQQYNEDGTPTDETYNDAIQEIINLK